MERATWLKQVREKAETLYDKIAPEYWVSFGFYENETHLAYLKKFLKMVIPHGKILSAGCGAGRYDGYLLDAGHEVVGIDQSEGMLKRAREHYPQVYYEKMGFQDLNFHEAFDGVICIDAMEHVSPEDYPGALRKFQQACKPQGVVYFTVDRAEPEDLKEAYLQAIDKGLPVVMGEVVDHLEESYLMVEALGDTPVPAGLSDKAVYHFYPTPKQIYGWIDKVGLVVIAEGTGSGYQHFIVRKK